MNKHQSSTKILIMCHYLICCKLTFNLHRNIKLDILNINITKLYLKFFFKIHFENSYLYAQNKFASYITIHLHNFFCM